MTKEMKLSRKKIDKADLKIYKLVTQLESLVKLSGLDYKTDKIIDSLGVYQNYIRWVRGQDSIITVGFNIDDYRDYRISGYIEFSGFGKLSWFKVNQSSTYKIIEFFSIEEYEILLKNVIVEAGLLRSSKDCIPCYYTVQAA